MLCLSQLRGSSLSGSLRDNGFVVARNVFSGDEVTELRRRVLPLFEEPRYSHRESIRHDRGGAEDPRRIFSFQKEQDLHFLNLVVLHPKYRRQLSLAVGPRISFTHAAATFVGRGGISAHRDVCDTKVIPHLCRLYAHATDAQTAQECILVMAH